MSREQDRKLIEVHGRIVATILLCAVLLPSTGCDLTADKDPIIVYVSPSGSDGYTGGSDEPFATLQAAIDYVEERAGVGEVRVAAGEYRLTEPMVLEEGVSLYGGYSETWERDTTANVSMVTFEIEAEDTGEEGNPMPVIRAGEEITDATVVDGLTITGLRRGNYVAGILCDNGSPTIAGNVITGSEDSQYSYGIYVLGGSPVISGNSIIGGVDPRANGYGIYCMTGATPDITGNILIQGAEDARNNAYGILTNDASFPEIRDNTEITGGSARGSSYGIRNAESSPDILRNALITGGIGRTFTYGIRNNNCAPKIAENTEISGGVIESSEEDSTTGDQGGEDSDEAPEDRPATYGIYNWQSSPDIGSNVLIYGGDGGAYSYGVFNDAQQSQPDVTDNSIQGGGGSEESLAIENSGGAATLGDGNIVLDGSDLVPDLIYVSVAEGNDENDGSTPGTAMATIEEAIDSIAGGNGTREIRVAAGEYRVENPVELVSEVTIRGGFVEGSWETPDPDANSTVIVYTGDENGTAALPTYAVYAGGDVDETAGLEGFTIRGKNGSSYSAAVVIEGGSPVIRSCILVGGDDNGSSYGLYITGDSQAEIRECSVYGGSDCSYSYGVYVSAAGPMFTECVIEGGPKSRNDSYGVYLLGGAGPTLTLCDVSAGSSTNTYSYGVYAQEDSTHTLTDCTVGGTDGTKSYGMYNDSCPTFTVEDSTILAGSGNYSYGLWNIDSSGNIYRNVIYGGSGSLRNIGIYNDSHSSPDIFNNVIAAGKGGAEGCYGIYCVDTSSPAVYNNTISGGEPGGTGDAVAVFVNDSQPTLRNNILFAVGGGGDIIGIWEADAYGDPQEVSNNVFLDTLTTTLYRDEGDTARDIGTVAGIEDGSLTGTVAIDNYDGLSSAIFVNYAGTDGDPATVTDNQWNLTAGASADVRQGGADLSDEFTDDVEGNERDVPWSVGAYEWD